MTTRRTIGLLAFVTLTALCALPAPAQNTGGPGRDMAGFRQRILDRIKEQMGATDEDFKALQPKIENVMQLQRDAGAMRMGRMFRQPSGDRPAGDRPATERPADANPEPQSDVQQKSADLQAALDNKDTKPEEIKAKLDALRAAKVKAKEELIKAQADLKTVLSVREEAVLVEMGILE